MLDSPRGTIFFYRLRIIREKLALSKYDDLSYIKTTYKERFGREINLKDPQTYTEKLQWLKLFYKNSDMPICSDKFAVREYLKERGYNYLLNDLQGVYENANDIDFDSLPNRFAAKATHGSGWNLICKDKSTIDWAAWKKIINIWLKLDLSVFGREWNYRDIEPKIIIEKFIEHTPLNNYKFMCFNGEPLFYQINLDINEKTYVDFYDSKWVKADFTYRGYSQSSLSIDKPTHFDEMIDLSRELSKPFPFVRVDFYNFNNRIVFGEMTFFPGGGLLPLIPIENNYDEKIGSLLELPKPNANLDLYNKLNR